MDIIPRGLLSLASNQKHILRRPHIIHDSPEKPTTSSTARRMHTSQCAYCVHINVERVFVGSVARHMRNRLALPRSACVWHITLISALFILDLVEVVELETA
jgi:hypothetical protein